MAQSVRGAFLVLACLLGLCAFPLPADASHFRFGKMSWKSGDGAAGQSKQVELTMQVAFRKSYQWSTLGNGPIIAGTTILGSGSTQIDWGDGTTMQGSAVVDAYSDVEDFWLGTIKASHTFATHNNSGTPWTIFFQTCCRIGVNSDPRINHVNNPDKNWYLSIDVDLWADGDAGNIQTPDVTTVPIVYLPDTGTHSFFLGGFDRGAGLGRGVTYSFSSLRHGLYDTTLPTLDMTIYSGTPAAGGAVGSINAATGEYTVTTTGLVKGLYSTQVVLTSDTTGLTSAVDFFIAVLAPEKICNADCQTSGGAAYTKCTNNAALCVACPVTCASNPTGTCTSACNANSPPTINVPQTLDVSLNCTANLHITASDANDAHNVVIDVSVLNAGLPTGAMFTSSVDNSTGVTIVDYLWVPDTLGKRTLCFYPTDTLEFGSVGCVTVTTHANDSFCSGMTMPPTPAPTPAPTPPPPTPPPVSTPWYSSGSSGVSGEGGGGSPVDGAGNSSNYDASGNYIGVGTPEYGKRRELKLDAEGFLVATPGCNVSLVSGVDGVGHPIRGKVTPVGTRATFNITNVTEAGGRRPPDFVVAVELLFTGEENVTVCAVTDLPVTNPFSACIPIRAGRAENCCADGSSALNRTCFAAAADVAVAADMTGIIVGSIFGALLLCLLCLLLALFLMQGGDEEEEEEKKEEVVEDPPPVPPAAPQDPPEDPPPPPPPKKTKPPLDWDDDFDGMIRPKGGKGAKRIGGGYKYWNPVTGKWQYEPPDLEWDDAMEKRFLAQEERVKKREALKKKEEKAARKKAKKNKVAPA